MKFEIIRRVCTRLCLQCSEHCCPKLKKKSKSLDLEGVDLSGNLSTGRASASSSDYNSIKHFIE